MMKTFLPLFFVKKTSIGLVSNYLSLAPLSYKIDLVKPLIHHAFKICTNWC